ncbi:MAG: hypothetical protein A3G52_04765 [Candidatus Taylorbacteria bacterium RIFCSPLOWO2_12_FULL_43_20]|uniref:Uncharacterized protein n=1 Tax=Candidatus Taylorbacteria bacterium RIFCSPLOWO2_12_FULL_43_20 TaxID=1802332 RepID=A0A1G2P2D8_9BACT|nr:MAG: hypothetical protein A2825_02755 [Candidatus Taylorbacteria bacterium RIFCSPHIGHO2_01_FULL_43_120]OHA23467.1 MAG: hypothetical protein A3B98_01310 [Candidatus Taylorbacteria bacterium RIFCSPHIGHO2_02_FULL_43_55]OHA29671.1 MAG: hypothetical protein A3E92_03615 [Candidatus Taylorbacteria bacterium RIFCSPHIGHO2_12_FULL_42_34]OHA31600.1 MAG: hypothetical protein A3B09_02710 [Candidatus Taylorbacteria bacterium RIFCSPLOWO2_01_FULL_43_83]OHA38980.1 MAG: hypothetical protein A3H58_00845 [Candi
MKDINAKKIEKLLKEERYDEARSLLADFFSQELTKEDRASLYLDYALLHLKVMNRIAARYNKQLKTIRKNLSELPENA